MNKINFLFEQSVDGVSEEDYMAMMPGIIAMAKGMEMCLADGLFIYDCHKQKPIFVSCHWSNFYKVEKDYFSDVDSLFGNLTKKDRKFCETVRKSTQKFYNSLSSNEYMNYLYSFPLEIKNNKESLYLYHRVIPIALSHTGKIWLILCTSFPTTKRMKRIVHMQKKNEDLRMKYNEKTQRWENSEIPLPNSKERRIFSMAIQGFSIEEMAEILQLSPDSVKACRRRAFERMGVCNIQEAITFTMNHTTMK